MIQDINRFYSEVDQFVNSMTWVERIPNHENLTDEEQLLYIFNHKTLSQDFNYLQKYIDNPEFIQELHLEEKEGFLPYFKLIFDDSFYYKICDFYKDKIDIKVNFTITNSSDINYLKNSGFKLDQIVSFNFYNPKLLNTMNDIDYWEKSGYNLYEIAVIFGEVIGEKIRDVIKERNNGLVNSQELEKAFENSNLSHRDTDSQVCVDLIIDTVMQGNYNLIKYIENSTNWKYFINKLIDLGFENIDEILTQTKNNNQTFTINDEELLKKLVYKYGIKGILLARCGYSDEIIDMLTERSNDLINPNELKELFELFSINKYNTSNINLKLIDLLAEVVNQGDYELLKEIDFSKYGEYLINKLIDLGFENIDELIDQIGYQFFRKSEEFEKKCVQKYGLKGLFFVKHYTNEIWELINSIPNITFEEYKKYSSTRIGNADLLLKFLNQGSKEAIHSSYNVAINDDVISYILNNFTDEEIDKIIDDRKLYNFLGVQKYLVEKGNINYLNQLIDIYQNIESFDFIYECIKKYNITSFNSSLIDFISGLVYENNKKLVLPTDNISMEVAERLIDIGYNINMYLNDNQVSENLTELFLKKGDYGAILKANKSQIQKYINMISIESLASLLTEDTKCEVSNDLLKYIIINGHAGILNEYFNSPSFKKCSEINFDEQELHVIKGLLDTNLELVEKLFNKLTTENQVELVKSNPKLIYEYQGNDIKCFEECNVFSSNIPWEAINFYNGNKAELIYNYEKYLYFIELCGFDIEKVVQYALANSYDWIAGIDRIIESNKLDEFLKAKNALLKDDLNSISSIEQFILIMKNYERYPELCNDIANRNIELNEEKQMQLDFIFDRNEKLEGQYKPTCIEDCSKIKDLFKQQYMNSTNITSIIEMKNFLCNVLFNCSYADVEKNLSIYGDTAELKKLSFNDKSNPEIEIYVQEMLFYTQMMEKIVYCDDFELLKEIALNVANNFDLAIECSMNFTNYDKKMKKFYELESQKMLTKISNIKSEESLIDKEMSNKYGTEVLDFSDKKYTLFSHVYSEIETIEEVVKGIPKKGHNFICLSPISDRNQKYYGGGRNIIFLYDYLPDNSFIMSSVSNMGSNGSLKENSTEVTDIYREQRGIIETSSAPKQVNSEVLCFREGLKPFGIALPGGREPTEEELEIASEHNLKFVKTQEKETSIANPKEIEMESEDEKETLTTDSIDKLKRIREQLIPNNKSKRRQIAILTDPHALFEPTLAILEDARRHGITEIYSLGDNVGTGPNPGEVVDLLDEYGVKSVMGNHELYALEGVEKFVEHFNRTGGYDEAKRNSEWTRSKLTDRQKEKIRLYPEFLKLMVGGKKVLLCHYIKDFNSDEMRVDPQEFDRVLQGHIHFEREEENISTLRGAGIGGTEGTASYIILQEKPEGGFEIITREIPFDKLNLGYSINESDLDEQDAEKITGWSHASIR